MTNNGRLRILAKMHDFTGLLDVWSNQIRQTACGDAAVLLRGDGG